MNIAVELRRADRRSVDEGLPVQTDRLRDLLTRSLEPVGPLLLPSVEFRQQEVLDRNAGLPGRPPGYPPAQP